MKKQITLLLFILLGFWAIAQTNQELLSKAGNAEDYPHSNILVIYDSTQVQMQATGLSYYQMHKLFKILTYKGAKNNHVIKIAYDPLSA